MVFLPAMRLGFGFCPSQGLRLIWTEERMDEVLAGVAGGIHAINVGPINVEMKRAIN